jgi:hypothetical protein
MERNPDFRVVCSGDFNTDFNSDRPHNLLLTEFCYNKTLQPAVRHVCSKVDYTYNFNMECFSTIDHFLLCEPLFENAIRKLYVSHDVHDPLLIHLASDFTRSSACPRLVVPTPERSKASADDRSVFCETQRANLATILLEHEALLCRNLNCCNANHTEMLNQYTCVHAGQTCIPLIRPPLADRIPGWNEYVAPFLEKSLFLAPVMDSQRLASKRYHCQYHETNQGTISLCQTISE